MQRSALLNINFPSVIVFGFGAPWYPSPFLCPSRSAFPCLHDWQKAANLQVNYWLYFTFIFSHIRTLNCCNRDEEFRYARVKLIISSGISIERFLSRRAVEGSRKEVERRQPLISCTISPTCREIPQHHTNHKPPCQADGYPLRFIASTTSGKGSGGLEQQANCRHSVNVPFSSPIFILPLTAKHIGQIKKLETVAAFAATATFYLPRSNYICPAQFPLNPFASISLFSMHDI